ncbi:putative integral membrane protein (apicoplast) [Theileria parva strain Muguga]|uniref:Uncharacterized protein n=1 Tax=Theileria parva TaxID=5875 RepID=Q4MYA2_THEPA|nr:putative integral membrane protein [Theileria parva strain Muguga]|eukprot:XP_762690.1 hypothetical protein (apicoplast) [Theileria parva strain Muguga]
MIDLKLNKIIKYIYIDIINTIVIIYINLKNIIINTNKILDKNLLLKYNYNKLFNKIFNTITLDITYKKNQLIKVYNAIVYMFKKYILNYSFVKLCWYYITDLDLTNLDLHIHKKLDIYTVYKNKIKILLIFLKSLLIYIIDKYYYKHGKLYFLLKYLTNKETYKMVNTLNKLISIKVTDLIFYHDELKFLIKLFYKTDYIILNNIDKIRFQNG